MSRHSRAWALLGMWLWLSACESEATAPRAVDSAGNASGSSGALGAVGGAGAASTVSLGGASGGDASNGGAVSAGGDGTDGYAAASGGGGASSGLAGLAGIAGATGGDASAGSAGAASALPKRVLLYYFSTLVIDTLPAQLDLIAARLESWGYEVERSTDPVRLSAESLTRFAAVAMINTCFEPFGAGKSGLTEAAALKAFVENGGGLFGTHCASVTFQSVEPPHPYNALIGGRGGHGFFEGVSSCRKVADHVSDAALPSSFEFDGNLDNADYVAADSTVLVKCKWSSGELLDTAVSWYRTPGKGRVFYTNFAKAERDLREPSLGELHVLRGLGWVLGR